MRSNAYLRGLPSVSLAGRAELPEIPGVYIAFAEHADILYVGMSMNLRKRWQSHHRTSNLITHPGTRIYYVRLDAKYTPRQIRRLEAYCIKRFVPRYNNAPILNIWQARFALLYRQYRRLEARTQQEVLWP